jgi:hypothetical protein
VRDLGDFLVEGGAIVGGGAALFATLGFIAGSLVHDFHPESDPEEWARKGAAFGGVGHRLFAVNKRTRHYVWLAVCAVAGLIYGRISRDWSFGTFYAGFAVVVSVVGLIGLSWTEFAPDGAFRGDPQT